MLYIDLCHFPRGLFLFPVHFEHINHFILRRGMKYNIVLPERSKSSSSNNSFFNFNFSFSGRTMHCTDRLSPLSRQCSRHSQCFKVQLTLAFHCQLAGLSFSHYHFFRKKSNCLPYDVGKMAKLFLFDYCATLT